MRHRKTAVGRVGVAERLGAELAHRFLVHLKRAAEQEMIVPARAPDPMKEMVDLVDQCFNEWPCVRFDMWQQIAQGRVGRETEARGEHLDVLFTGAAAILEDMSLRFDFATQAEHRVGVALEQRLLLLFEEAEERSVFDEFLPQTFCDELPVHVILKSLLTFRSG